MSDKEIWIDLKYITEQYFGSKNIVCKIDTPISDEKSLAIPFSRGIPGWEIFVDFDVSDILSLETIDGFREEIRNMGFVFIDADISMPGGRYELYFRMVSKEDYEKWANSEVE